MGSGRRDQQTHDTAADGPDHELQVNVEAHLIAVCHELDFPVPDLLWPASAQTSAALRTPEGRYAIHMASVDCAHPDAALHAVTHELGHLVRGHRTTGHMRRTAATFWGVVVIAGIVGALPVLVLWTPARPVSDRVLRIWFGLTPLLECVALLIGLALAFRTMRHLEYEADDFAQDHGAPLTPAALAACLAVEAGYSRNPVALGAGWLANGHPSWENRYKRQVRRAAAGG